jgi:HAD superfamily hydrolase (TIGR01509 family)
MINTLLFDLNGVIADTEEINFEVWKVLYEENGFLYNETIYDNEVDGKKTIEVIRHIAPNDGDIEKLVKRRDDLWFEMEKKIQVKIFRDAKNLLDIMKKEGYKLGIVTSSRKCQFVLRKLNIWSMFEVIVDGTCIKNGKPNSEIIDLARAKLNCNKENVLLIEDSLVGVETGENAQVHTIFLNRKRRNVDLKYGYMVYSLDEINPDWINKINNTVYGG